jgi:hypothetical protein
VEVSLLLAVLWIRPCREETQPLLLVVLLLGDSILLNYFKLHSNWESLSDLTVFP